jgi:hypothetical protein
MIAENPRVAQNPQDLALISSDDGDNPFDSMESSRERGSETFSPNRVYFLSVHLSHQIPPTLKT